MRRRLFTVASVLSLLLCAPTVWLWVRSYSGQDRLERRRYEPSRKRRVETVILTSRGSVYFMREYETCVPVSFIYLMSDDHLQNAGDVSLPWTHDWADFKAGFAFFMEPVRNHNLLERLGFYSDSLNRTIPSRLGTISVTDQDSTIRLRFGSLLLLLLLLPGYATAMLCRNALARWHGRITNTCPTCGYSLIGNTSGVCPECGTPTTQERSTKSK